MLDQHLGAMNGFAASVGSLVRAIAPVACGSLFSAASSISESPEVAQGLPFYLLVLHSASVLDAGIPLLGARCVVLSGVAPALSLDVADSLLSRGAASCEICVPLPSSGFALGSDAAMRLALRIQRRGFDSLMAELGYRGCDPRAEAVGNRQRLSWSLMRADDVEQLGLTLHAADYLLIHASDASPLAGDEEAARRAMRVGLLRRVLAALRRRGHPLHRDAAVPRLWWARLRRPATGPPEL